MGKTESVASDSESLRLFNQLLHAESEDEVERILDGAGYGSSSHPAWKNLGDNESNFTTVGNQQADATAALIEKLINGIDAVLMSECLSLKLDPESQAAPISMNDAVEKFFNITGGRLESLSPTAQGVLAEKIQLVAVGEKTSPSYLIIDRGEGQTPDTFLKHSCRWCAATRCESTSYRASSMQAVLAYFSFAARRTFS